MPKMLKARLALGAFVAAILCGLGVALSPDPNPPFVPPAGATSDLEVFRRVVDRVRDGGSFYDVTQNEFRAHGYPTRSVFNWRSPCYAWLIGRVTGRVWGRWLVIAGAVLAMVMLCRECLDRCGLGPASLGGVFLIGSLAWCFDGETFLFTEVWAGTLLALSVCAFWRRSSLAGVVLGLFALFYRELALPYALVGLAFAMTNGRRTEALAWGIGLILFGAFLAWHASVVHARLGVADKALEGGWVRFGGVRFLLATAQTNVYLMPRPLWVTAVYLPFACLGLAGMRGEMGWRLRWTSALYLIAYSVVGNPFNFYWGLVNAPLLAIGVSFAPGRLHSLIVTAFPRSEPYQSALSASLRGPDRI